jgi:hypothetical protein
MDCEEKRPAAGNSPTPKASAMAAASAAAAAVFFLELGASVMAFPAGTAAAGKGAEGEDELQPICTQKRLAIQRRRHTSHAAVVAGGIGGQSRGRGAMGAGAARVPSGQC